MTDDLDSFGLIFAALCAIVGGVALTAGLYWMWGAA